MVIGSADVGSYYMVSGVAFALKKCVIDISAPLTGFALQRRPRVSGEPVRINDIEPTSNLWRLQLARIGAQPTTGRMEQRNDNSCPGRGRIAQPTRAVVRFRRE
jgi:hypothetical protein